MEGKLLIAHPLLNDGFFNRSVIYMTAHNEEGSIGFCLNFRTQFLLKDVRPNIRHGNFPIYEGGPVAKNQLFFLHTLGHDLADSVAVKGGLFFGGDFNELMHMIDHGKVKSTQVRFFAGYSGWGEGQLLNEIVKKHWLIQQVKNTEFFTQDPSELWGDTLKDFRSSYGIFANFGSDPSMN